MRATLEFTLPEDGPLFQLHLHGPEFERAISTLDNALRERIKYRSEEFPEETIKEFEELRRLIHEELEEVPWPN